MPLMFNLPNRVTVAGHGQGATIAHLLALNPATSGPHPHPHLNPYPHPRAVLQDDPGQWQRIV